MENYYVVYENWRASRKAVVHQAKCGYAKESHEKIQTKWIMNNKSQNDRWFGYFKSFEDANTFASLLPNRNLIHCKHCIII